MFNVNLATKLLNESMRDKDDPEADRVDLDYLPDEFSQLLNGRKKDGQLVRNFQTEENFVHQSIHSSDPLCRFSKDCMHQTQVLWNQMNFMLKLFERIDFVYTSSR